MAQVNLGRVVGYSAYEIAVQNGFIGTEAEWLASLQGAEGATGAPGQNGQDGAPGAAATISVGTVSTGSAGSSASVVNVGTTSAAVLDFVIPAGPQGPAGSYTAGNNITISEGTISATFTESDPIFAASAAASITASDISDWNAKQDALTAGSNITISGNEISASFTFTESDPVFGASPAASITTSDISAWNAIEGVPSVSSASAGDVLTVSGGSAVWVAPQSGGSSYSAGTGIDITNDVISIDDTVVATISNLPEGVPNYSGASEGDVLTVDNLGELSWTAPSAPSEIEYESTHSSGEDYMLTKVNGDDGVSIVAMTYDNDEYVEGDNVSIYSGGIDIGRGDGTSFISINPIEIGFNGLDSNDDPVSGSLSMSTDGELQWNGSSIIPTYTSSDAGKVLSVNSLGDSVEWATAGGGGSSYTMGQGMSVANSKLISAAGGGLSQSTIIATGSAGTYSAYTDYKLTFGEANKTASDRIWAKIVVDGKVYFGEMYKGSTSTTGRVYYSADNSSWNDYSFANNIANLTVYLTNNKYVETTSYPSINFNSTYNIDEIVVSKYLTVNPIDTKLIPIDNDTINLKRVSGVNTLVANTPSCPTTTDGTYVLKATVSSGAVTYSWVAES